MAEQISIAPQQFYKLTELSLKFWANESFQKRLLEVSPTLETLIRDLTIKQEILLRASNELRTEERFSVKKKKDQEDELSQNQDESDFDRTNIIRVMLEIVHQMINSTKAVHQVIKNLQPGYLAVSEDKKLHLKKYEDMQQYIFEMQMNMPVMNRLYSALVDTDALEQMLSESVTTIAKMMENYYQYLHHRHTVEGVEIIRDPIITDIALGIYSNIDSNGEIKDGKNADEVSKFTLTKAKILIEAIVKPEMYVLLNDGKFNSIIVGAVVVLADLIVALRKDVQEPLNQFEIILNRQSNYTRNLVSASYKVSVQSELNKFASMNPNALKHKDPNKILSKEEKWVAQFRTETLTEVVKLLTWEAPEADRVIKYVLERKERMRKFFQDENSFYVCKISAGNPFGGEAPGALKVIPGQRPNATIDSIVGAGFSEVKEFVKSIEAASKWHDLFVATSPSKSADKSNILLIGPQGCGKTEVMRAVASDKNSIGIFAQGSDFKTCWKGEAEKNPKRLFEAGLGIQKSSKKHVHFLIDEIDSILNNDQSFSMDSNLTLEFQILMDGVVSYPNLSVWGATNNPQRIPMPMIRRFSKVLIVGELNVEHRVQLLQQFVGFMPISNWTDQSWIDMANKLEGATGDVIRKVVDHIWREKMTRFTQSNPTAATQLLGDLRGSGPFQVTDFDKEKRRAFKEKLKHHVSVTPEDIRKSIDMHLNNIAIRNEIATAVKTYRDAHDFLSNLSKEEV